MIFYLVTDKHRYTMDTFIQSWGKALEQRVWVFTYNSLLQSLLAGRIFLNPGTYIFSDIERVTPKAAQIFAGVWEKLSAKAGQVRLLNHPLRSMKRYELMRTLFETGKNHFNIYRLSDDVVPERFPVFIRGENDHLGNVTDLVHTREDFYRTRERLAGGKDGLKEKLIVEFVDTSRKGLFRKYSAFAVGKEIIPRHVFFSSNWMVKAPDIVDRETIAEEKKYVSTNPHAERLRELFAMAEIDYGRIDYSLLGDEIQVWEINTNPMVASGISSSFPERKPVHDIFLERFVAAFEALDRPGRGGG